LPSNSARRQKKRQKGSAARKKRVQSYNRNKRLLQPHLQLAQFLQLQPNPTLPKRLKLPNSVQEEAFDPEVAVLDCVLVRDFALVPVRLPPKRLPITVHALHPTALL
jgi:hypothetical protein